MKYLLVALSTLLFSISANAKEEPNLIGTCIGILASAANQGIPKDKIPPSAISAWQKYYPSIERSTPKVAACVGDSMEIEAIKKCISNLPNSFDRELYRGWFVGNVTKSRNNFDNLGLQGAVNMMNMYCAPAYQK